MLSEWYLCFSDRVTAGHRRTNASDAVVKGGDMRREKTMILAAVQTETNTFIEQKGEDLKGFEDG